MKVSSFTDFVEKAADLILPNSCALCGASLCLENSAGRDVPLCNACRIAADEALYINSYSSLRRCRSCGYPLTSENSDCLSCRDKDWNFQSSLSLFLYNGIGRDLICSYKFENRRGLASYFADLILRYHQINHSDAVIIPVPFRPASKRKRGWDHIEEITSLLKKNKTVEISPCLRRDNGPAQKTMNYNKRLLNLNDRIHFNSKLRPPLKALLLDDVFTTGATLDYCAGVLKEAGTVEIYCLAIALDL
ncbi:MAG: ComF family protein [Spirochaetales bacterium]|nr:ComF family protein [Spirochaetales bacterium]